MIVPVDEEQSGIAPESHLLELLYGSVSTISFVMVLATCLALSPVAWWLYGPRWAIGAAIASVILFGLSPFIHLFKPVLFVNIIYCVFVLGQLMLF